MLSRLRLVLSLTVILGLAGFSLGEISYRVKPLPETQELYVEIIVPVQATTITLQMPNWAPGSYRLANNFNNVLGLRAQSDTGARVEGAKTNDYTWTFPASGKSMKFSYTVVSRIVGGAMHYSGPSTYLYVADRMEESCRLDLFLPTGWKAVTGLDAIGVDRYTAPTYDVLADNPVTLGDFILDTYTVRGKPHYIALRGSAGKDVDRAYLLKACRFVSEAQTNFFGGAPYNKYVWHFSANDAYDGAGGLEHLSSTQITLGSGLGPGVVSVLSHEFFHLWNVKRIRSKPLGPFDYTALPKTGALWWLEGVTDYYGNFLLFRYGWLDEKAFHQDVIGNLAGVRANPRRMEVSIHDASYRVGEAANGRGNSNGFGVSYYNSGYLAGLCLDIEIRSQSGGRHSLDDVMLALWKMTKDNKPGFAEEEIRKQCIRFGGPALGPFYDKVIMQPGELPVEAQLAKMGLKLFEGPEQYTRTGFQWASSRGEAGAPGYVRVAALDAEGPAKDILQRGDRILAINGKSVELDTNKNIYVAMKSEMDKAKIGQPISLKVKRGDSTLDVQVTPIQGTREKAWQVVPMSAGTATKELREAWYWAGKPHRS